MHPPHASASTTKPVCLSALPWILLWHKERVRPRKDGVATQVVLQGACNVDWNQILQELARLGVPLEHLACELAVLLGLVSLSRDCVEAEKRTPLPP